MQKSFRFLGRTLSSPYRWTKSGLENVKSFLTEEPEDTPLADVVSKTVEDVEGIFFHVNELRKRLLWSVLFLAMTTVISFIFTRQIIDYLTIPIGGITKLVAIDPTESIGVFMRVALLSGFAMALPFIAFQLWLFIAPGVSKKSRLYGLFAIPATVVFFLGGMAFAYFLMLPTALPFLLNFMGLTTVPRPSSYIAFVTNLMFWVGIAFEFPLVIYVLAGMGLIKARSLANQWRIAIVIIAVAAAAITPTVDPVNMSLVMGPMVVLFFLSVGLAYLAQRGRN